MEKPTRNDFMDVAMNVTKKFTDELSKDGDTSLVLAITLTAVKIAMDIYDEIYGKDEGSGDAT